MRRLEARRRDEPPVMRLGDLIGKELVGLPPRVAKSVSSIKSMPMPYDLLPTEMRARTAKERQERRRRKKKRAETSQPGPRERSQSLLHWTWEPSLSDTQISLSTSGTRDKPRRRIPKKPVFAKPAMVVDTEQDRTEMLRRLQERQVMHAERTNVAIMAKRSARECEIKSNTFTPTRTTLPDFYIDRLFLDGERKPGQSRVDSRRHRKRRVAQAIGRQWGIPKSAWSDDDILLSRKDTAAAGTASTARQNRSMAPEPEPEPEIEPEPSQSALPRKASSPITVIPQVIVESQDAAIPHTQAPILSDPGERSSTGSPATQVTEPKLASVAAVAGTCSEQYIWHSVDTYLGTYFFIPGVYANADIAGAISPPKVISHKVGPPGLEIPAGWECGSVGPASSVSVQRIWHTQMHTYFAYILSCVCNIYIARSRYYFFHIDDPGKIYWDHPPWLDGESSKVDEGGADEDDDSSDAAALAAIDAELAALDRSLGHSSSQPIIASGGSGSMSNSLERSDFESDSVSSVSETVGDGSDGEVSDECDSLGDG